MEAIKSVGGEIVAALDPSDSVGILDRYAPKCAYFKEPERFWRWMSRRAFEGKQKPDWISICSPNWLHDAHVRMALASGCRVILEKPAVLTARNYDCLMSEFPKDCRKNVFVCHQLRWHPDTLAILYDTRAVADADPGHRFKVKIVYHTPRGPWYGYSWKGDVERSGGPISNLGIHFLDMLANLYGKTHDLWVSDRDEQRVIGGLQMDKADVEFSLSTRFRDAPGGKPLREFLIDGENAFRFDAGFTGLHDKVYASAMQDKGVMFSEIREPIRIAEEIRLANYCC